MSKHKVLKAIGGFLSSIFSGSQIGTEVVRTGLAYREMVENVVDIFSENSFKELGLIDIENIVNVKRHGDSGLQFSIENCNKDKANDFATILKVLGIAKEVNVARLNEKAGLFVVTTENQLAYDKIKSGDLKPKEIIENIQNRAKEFAELYEKTQANLAKKITEKTSDEVIKSFSENRNSYEVELKQNLLQAGGKGVINSEKGYVYNIPLNIVAAAKLNQETTNNLIESIATKTQKIAKEDKIMPSFFAQVIAEKTKEFLMSLKESSVELMGFAGKEITPNVVVEK